VTGGCTCKGILLSILSWFSCTTCKCIL